MDNVSPTQIWRRTRQTTLPNRRSFGSGSWGGGAKHKLRFGCRVGQQTAEIAKDQPVSPLKINYICVKNIVSPNLSECSNKNRFN